MQDLKPLWKTNVASITDPSGAATAMTVDTGAAIGSAPTVPFYAVVRRPAATNGDPDNLTATIVKVTAMSGGSITTMVRDQGGASSFPIQVGDEVMQSLYHVLLDIEVPCVPTIQGLEDACSLFPGRTVKWPENYPLTDTTGDEANIGPAFNGGKIIIPISSPITPKAGSAAQSIIKLAGQTDAGRTVGATTENSDTVTCANTSGLSVGQSVYFTLTTYTTWFRSRIKSIVTNTSVTLYDRFCRSSTGPNTMYVVTPVAHVTVEAYGVGTGNTNTSTRLVESTLTEDCVFKTKGYDFSGALIRHTAGYYDILDNEPRKSGNGGGVDYGDIYVGFGDTNCTYRGRSEEADGNGYYLAHAHLSHVDIISRNGSSRGIHFAASCADGPIESLNSGTFGIMYSNTCHNCHNWGTIRNSYNYGLVYDNADGLNDNMTFEGVVTGCGLGPVVDEKDVYGDGLTGNSRIIIRNPDATFRDPTGFVQMPYLAGITITDSQFSCDTGSFTGTTPFMRYMMDGDVIEVDVKVTAGTLAGTPNEIRLTIPFSRVTAFDHAIIKVDVTNNAVVRDAYIFSNDGDTFWRIIRKDGSAWANGTTTFGFRHRLTLDPPA